MTPESAENLVQLFFSQAEAQGDRPFLWSKHDGTYRPQTWTEVRNAVIEQAYWLKKLGVKAGDRVIVVAENRPEWMVADLAIMSLGAITTPAYTTNTVNDHVHIISDSRAKAAIVSTKKLTDVFLKAAFETESLDFVLTIDKTDLKQQSAISVYQWDDAPSGSELAGAEQDILNEVARVQRTDTACIIYTSGTGGAPKGVMLSHGAILHNCAGAIDILQKLGLGHEVFLSFLPLSHSYEHTAGQFVPIAIAAEIYYAEGIETLATNMLEARPTIMAAVPRLYETLYQKITLGVKKAGGSKEKLFNKTIELGTKRYKHGRLGLVESILDTILTKLVRSKVADRFGGRLKALVSGGAPLNQDIGIFFTALGIRILQGYGQTESAPLISVNLPHKVKLHTVGPVVKDTELKIADDGEICVKGELVMQGYWNNEEATKAAIQDGWLHTGDIGELDDDGFITITDRKKDIIVNSGGDNVAPQRVEGLLCLNPEIAQAMVYGDKRPYLVGVIVPDADWLRDWAKAKGVKNDLMNLRDNKELHRDLQAVIEGSNQNLSIIEKVKRFTIAEEPFSIDNEMLTPTLKIRRHMINRTYGDTLTSLYGR